MKSITEPDCILIGPKSLPGCTLIGHDLIHLRRTLPPLQQAADAAPAAVYESYDAVRSWKARCEAQHLTTPRPGTHIRVVEEEAALVIFGGWLAARKETQNVRASGRATTTAVPASIHNNNWLGLQQTAAAAARCCRWLLLQRVAVLR